MTKGWDRMSTPHIDSVRVRVRRRHLRSGVVCATVIALSAVPAVSAAQPSSTTPTTAESSAAESSTSAPDSSSCPQLHLVVVNGTTESSVDAPIDQDSGFFAQVTVPAMQQANSGGETLLDRSYVNYPASYGGKPGDSSSDTYSQSREIGIENGEKIIADIAAACPDTKFFISGYSQGADIAATLTRNIGAGDGPIDGAHLAGAARFSDPTRAEGEPVFSSGNTSPAPAPGAFGDSVKQVQVAASAPGGGGIATGARETAGGSFGSVAGRVASWCTPGDLACDTPANAPLAKMVANISGEIKTNTQDPVGILTSVASALGQTVLYTGASVINNDIDFDSKAGHFTVKDSSKTVLNRMVAYSDPAKQQADGIDEAISAVTKIAGMGIGAAVTVAKDFLNPASIAQIAAAGVAGPQAVLGVLGAKVLGAAVKLVPPATIDNTVKRAFDEVKQGITDNKGLVKLATDTQYWDTIAKHGSYASTPVGPNGETAVDLTTQWIVALAHDLAGTSPTAEGNSAGSSSTDRSGPLLGAVGEAVGSATEILGDAATASSSATTQTSTQTTGSTATPTTAPATTLPSATSAPSTPAAVTTDPRTAGPTTGPAEPGQP